MHWAIFSFPLFTWRGVTVKIKSWGHKQGYRLGLLMCIRKTTENAAAAGPSNRRKRTRKVRVCVSLFSFKTAQLDMMLWCHPGTVLGNVTTRGKAPGLRSVKHPLQLFNNPVCLQGRVVPRSEFQKCWLGTAFQKCWLGTDNSQPQTFVPKSGAQQP